MGVNKRLIGAGATGSALPFAGQNFKHITYTGNDGTGHAITGVGFKPDLIIIKPRNQTENWNLYDSTRGTTKQLIPNSTAASTTQGQTVQSFDDDGFTLNGDNNVNKSGINYSAWCWKANGGTTSSNSNGSITSTVQANTAAGFSIVQWTGTGSNATIGHGLSSAPEWLVVKKINAAGTDWVWKNDVQLGAARGLYLNDDVGEQTDTTFWQSASPTSTVFSVGTSAKTNVNGGTYMAYCWHSVAGFSNSTTSSQYIGTGDSNGPTVNLGFEPSIIIIKSKDGSPTTDWKIYTKDTNEHLSINTTGQAGTNSGNNKIDFLSNGFKISGNDADINASGQSYNYYAYAADPDTEAPTLASSFNIETYAGTSATHSISGLGFSPNFVWLKERDGTDSHQVYDTIRGANNVIYPNGNNAQYSGSEFPSFDSDGFTVSGNSSNNESGKNYVAWTWKANDDEPAINTNGTVDSIVSVNDNAGFSIVEFTTPASPGSSTRVGHGLSSAPDMILLKRTDGVEDWYVYHTGMGTTKNMRLNTTGAMATATNLFNTVNATVFNPSWTLTGNQKAIAYCFNSVTGYQKFGSYTGDGTTTKSITTGFKVDFVLIKISSGSDQWVILDSRRGGTKYLQPNLSAAEGTESGVDIDFTSTGFTLTGSGGGIGQVNSNGSTYIYWAIAKNVPSNTTLANSFKAITYAGNGGTQSITGTGFRPDFVWCKARNAANDHSLYDTLRGPAQMLHSQSNVAIQSQGVNGLQSFDADGFTVVDNSGGGSGVNGNLNYIAWAWKAGNQWQSNLDGTIPSTVNANTANGFSIVKYQGDGSTSKTVGHGLSSAPEIVFVKRLDSSADWYVWATPVMSITGSTSDYIVLNSSAAKVTAASVTNLWGGNVPSATTIGVGDSSGSNASGGEYIAYCFHSISGYSKIGSYSGTGSSNSITGLGFQPDWIIIKEADGVDSWEVYDSVRGDDKVLYPNGSNAEGTGSNFTSFDSDGFTVSSATSINENGKTYLYMAFKMN